LIYPDNGSEVKKMSDMKVYEGEYSYDGAFKHKKDGSSELKVRNFTCGEKLYYPNDPITFKITREIKDYNQFCVEVESIAVRISGNGLCEVLGNTFMMIASQYEQVVDLPDEKVKSVKGIRDIFRKWDVYVLERKGR
jgi:hypothetical protein